MKHKPIRKLTIRRNTISRSRTSASITFVLIGALTVAGCEDTVDIKKFASVNECLTSGSYTEAQCKVAFDAAQQLHQAEAPRFEDKTDCEAIHGYEKCGPAPNPVATGGQTHTHSNGFSPIMMYWLMNRSDRGSNIAAPVYPHADGTVRTHRGTPVSGTTIARKELTPTGRATYVVPSTRGGFGGTARNLSLQS